MSGKTQFWLGSVMLALAMGLLVGSTCFPRASWGDDHHGEGRAGNYALVTGIPGNTSSTETLYVVDDANQFVYIFEYKSRGKDAIEARGYIDLQEVASNLIKKRAEPARK